MIPDDLTLILASASPRRRLLLRQIGLEFSIHPSHANEDLDSAIPPDAHVKILSERKASDVASFYDDAVIVGADTIVVVDDQVITKPTSKGDAAKKLSMLSGRKHEVYTGFTIRTSSGSSTVTEFERTEVWFRHLSNDEIERYIQSGSPMDKAGAYGIQDDFGAVFIEKIHGDYYNVVGLPLCKFYTTLRAFIHHMNRRNGTEV